MPALTNDRSLAKTYRSGLARRTAAIAAELSSTALSSFNLVGDVQKNRSGDGNAAEQTSTSVNFGFDRLSTHPTSRRGGSSGCWRTGARHLRATTSITPAGDRRLRRSRWWLMHCVGRTQLERSGDSARYLQWREVTGNGRPTCGHCADHPHALAQCAPVGTVASVAISFFCKKSELGTHCLMDLVMEIT